VICVPQRRWVRFRPSWLNVRGLATAAWVLLVCCVLWTSVGCKRKAKPENSPTAGRAAAYPVEAINQYCAMIQNRTEATIPDFVVGVIYTLPDRQEEWKMFASIDALKEAWESNPAGDAAYVWAEEGKIVTAKMTFQSDTGDWAQHADYCFRSDGTTAQISSELRTFIGNVIARRTWSLARSGEVLRKDEVFLDLETERSKPPGADFEDRRTPLYLKVGDLPFHSLLSERNPNPSAGPPVPETEQLKRRTDVIHQ
jgi:hypothetical protein